MQFSSKTGVQFSRIAAVLHNKNITRLFSKKKKDYKAVNNTNTL
jgi:hypothetical protein